VADTATGELLGIWRQHQGAIWSLAVSPDGTLLASGGAARVAGWSGGDDLTICLWDARRGRLLARWQAHDSGVTALAFLPGGVLVSGGGDGSVKLWNLSALQQEMAALGLGL
jgi:WD40 repeat protein